MSFAPGYSWGCFLKYKGQAAFNMIWNMEIIGAIQMPRSAQEPCGWDRQGKKGQEGLNASLKSDESWKLAKYDQD